MRESAKKLKILTLTYMSSPYCPYFEQVGTQNMFMSVGEHNVFGTSIRH